MLVFLSLVICRFDEAENKFPQNSTDNSVNTNLGFENPNVNINTPHFDVQIPGILPALIGGKVVVATATSVLVTPGAKDPCILPYPLHPFRTEGSVAKGTDWQYPYGRK